MVISPAVPPYSSTTTAMCCRIACISDRSGGARLGVGHEVRGADDLLDPLGELHVGLVEVPAYDVLQIDETLTSSRFSPMTGSRE